MAENDEQQAERPSEKERRDQYTIDRITARYVVEFREGLSPRIEEYVQRYPQFRRELLEFAVYFHTVGFDAAKSDEIPADKLSPAAQKALVRMQKQRAAAPSASIDGLAKRAATVGYSPRELAQSVGLTTDLLGKLEARVLDVATIPPTLVRQLAGILKVAPDAVATYLGAAGPGQSGAFYYADQPPTQQQESFMNAVQASELSPYLKHEWDEIVKEDAGRGA